MQKKGPAVNYNAFKDFFNSETIAHILAAWMHFAGMQSIDGIKLYLFVNMFTQCMLLFNIFLYAGINFNKCKLANMYVS